MPAPKGNQFWKARSKHGRNPIFSDPKVLWTACVEYFDWNEANPLWEDKAYAFQGEIKHDILYKMRAMTISGMCLFLDISEDAWANYRKKKGMNGVTTRAEKIIYNQKFAGASADLLNPNIIARDLGLTDKKELKVNVNVESDLTDAELTNIAAAGRARVVKPAASAKKPNSVH